jgi:hypothetical protein
LDGMRVLNGRVLIAWDGTEYHCSDKVSVKSLPIPTPFSRPIATPYRVLVRAYPRHA